MAQDAVAQDVVVVGGGVAGLTAAVLLSSQGWRVTVLEASDRCGGRAASGLDTHTGDEVDIGPHVLSTEHRNFLSLLERLGTAGQVQWQPDPLITLLDAGERLHMRTRRWPAPLHALPNLPRALRRVSWRDLLSNWRVGWEAARLNEADTLQLDDRDALTHLRHLGVSERFTTWFWRSATLALLNVPLEHCSAAALMRVARLLAGISGAHFGFPRVALADLFVPAATDAIEAAGGRVLLRTAATRVVRRGAGVVGVELANGDRLPATAVVLALPPQALAALPVGDGLHAPWQGLAGQFLPCPYVSTVLWFDRPLSTEAFWARPWAAGDLNTDFYDLARLRQAPMAAPSVVAANAIHAVEAWHRSDGDLIAQTQAEVAQFAPEAARAHLRHARVHRIPMAVLCPRPGTERARPPNETPWPGVWIAGDWTATSLPCSMESAARSGAQAAEAAARHLGRPARWALPRPETGGLMALVRRR